MAITTAKATLINKFLRFISPTFGTDLKAIQDNSKKAVSGTYDFDTDADSFTFLDADVSVSANTITEAGHGLRTGDTATLTTTGTLPTGLSADTAYYVIYVNSSTIKLATTRANAVAGTAIDITAAAGTGTHTLKKNVLGQIDLGVTLPDNAIVTRTFYQVNDTFTDGGDDNTTIALQINGANDIVTATAISAGGNVWDAGNPVAGAQDNAIGNFLKLTAERELLMVVAVDDITAGSIQVFVEYVEGL